MAKDRQITEMCRIIDYISNNDYYSIDLWKLKYLFERFERCLDDGAIFNSNNMDDLINKLAAIAHTSQKELKLFCYSFLLRITNNSIYIIEMLKMCTEGEINDPFEINFVRWRCLAICFKEHSMSIAETYFLSQAAYEKSNEGFLKIFNKDLRFIPKNNRDENNVVVMTSQYLDMSHAPTKTLLARCHTLSSIYNMKVSIINTREHLTRVGRLPYYKLTVGGVEEKYNDLKTVAYGNDTFDFYQSPIEMPDVNEIKKIFSMIYEKKPYFIVQIGGNSITADLCSKIVPVLTVGTVFSAIPSTFSQFRTLGRALTDDEIEYLESKGIDRDGIIESIFTSDLREQTEKYTREDFNLPNDKFLIMLVGWRLNDEIDDDFLKMMSYTYDNTTLYVFIGPADRIKKRAESDANLFKHSVFLGTQKDLLAIAEVCDLYVNPKRTGGGMSAVEAMQKGLPVVTLPVGDVGVNAGENFIVSDYNQMAATIKRYAEDRQFYKNMSEKAVMRAKELIDTNKEFKAIIDKMLNSRLFS